MPEDTKPATYLRTVADLHVAQIKMFDSLDQVVAADNMARELAAVVWYEANEDLRVARANRAAVQIVNEYLPDLPDERKVRYGLAIAKQWELNAARRGPASTAPEQQGGTVADPVEHARGEFVHEATDLVVRGAGIDFAFHRTYRHQTIFDGPFGHRWDHAYNLALQVDPIVARLWTGSGRSEGYRRHDLWGSAGFHYYVPPDGVDATLEPVGPDPDAPAGWVRLAPDGMRHVFEPEPGWSGTFRLQRVEDRWGNYLAFTYADGRISVCHVNSDHRFVQFAYDELGRIIRVTDHAGRAWRYVYDAHGDLVHVITPPSPSQPRGSRTEYRYSSSSHGGVLAHNLTDIFDASGRHFLETRYGTAVGQPDYNRVTYQRLGHGDFWFRYEPVDPIFPGELRVQDRPTMRCWVKERNGAQTVYTYNEWGGLLRKEESVKAPGHAPRRAVSRYRYNRDGVLIASRTPEGVVTHALTGRDHFLRVHELDLPATPNAEDELWRHDALSASERRGFGRVLATVQRAALDTGGSVEWNERWGDVYAVDDDDLIVKHTYEPAFGQLLTTSDPRVTASPDPRAAEPSEYTALLTTYEYAGPTGAPTRDLVRVISPRPTLPDGALGDAPVVEILERDARGRVLRMRDAAGTETQTAYYLAADDEREGFVREVIIDPGTGNLQITTRFEVDELGRVVATTLPRGVDSNDGRFIVTSEYDALDRVVRARRATPLATETRTRYEPAGKPAEIETDWTTPGASLGVVKRTFKYNEEHDVIRETWGGTDKSAHFRIAHKYNASSTLRFSLAANDTSVHYRYDSRDQRVRSIRGRGTAEASTAETSYDLDGRVVALRSGEGRTTTTVHDAFGRVTAVTDPLGNVTRTSYDRGGRPTVVRFFERRADATYWLLGRTETVYDELGRAVRGRINIFDEPLSATDLDDDYEATPGPGTVAESLTFYDAADRVVKTVDANGNAHERAYDAAGRLATTIDPIGNRVEYRYDSHGNVIRKDRRDVAGLGEEVFTWLGTYDERDRLTAETDSLGNVTAYAYDSLDRRVRTTDPLGNVTEVTYDVYGRLTSTIERRTETGRGGGPVLPPAIVQYEHDRAGNVIARIDALGRRTGLRYDRLDRPIEEIFPDGARVVTRYDRDDLVAAVRDANGVVLRHTYDDAGRLVRTDVDRTEVDAGVTIEGVDFVEQILDGLGRVRVLRIDVSTITTVYDSRGAAVSEETDIDGFDVSPLALTRGFDAVGALTSLEYPGGRLLEFVRDDLVRVEVVRHLADGDGYPGSASNSARDLVTFTHIGNRVSKVERGNAYGTLLSYDGAGRLVEFHHTSVGDTALRSQQLHDAARNPRVRIELGPSSTQGTPPPERADNFGYDSQYQLIARASAPAAPSDFVDLSAFRPATAPPTTFVERQSLIDPHLGPDVTTGTDWWVYDLVGNRTASALEGAPDRSYEPNTRDQYDEVDSVTYSYDAAGNLLADGTYLYRYDAWRRLCRVIETATNTTIASYTYDGHGRRIIEAHASAADPLYVAYDGADRIADYRNDALVAVYTHGDAIDAPLHAALDGSELWYHSDHQGSVRAITDGDGKTIASYRFDPYGNLVLQDGLPLAAPTPSLAAQPFGFGSRPFDAAVALYDQRARTYSPSLGRFLQRDPGGPVDGTNPYQYAGNHPMAYGDPGGMSREEMSTATRPHSKTGGSFLGGLGRAWVKNPLNIWGPALLYQSYKRVGDLTDLLQDRPSLNLRPPSLESLQRIPEALGQPANPLSSAGTTTGLLWTYEQSLKRAEQRRRAFQQAEPAFAGLPIARGLVRAKWAFEAYAAGDYEEAGAFVHDAVTMAASDVLFLGNTAQNLRMRRGVAPEISEPKTIQVSRWGRPGLEAGDWVMKGRKSILNYLLSGKLQPGLGNQYAPYRSGTSYTVPANSIRWPRGGGFDGWIKGLFRQRKYMPPAGAPPSIADPP